MVFFVAFFVFVSDAEAGTRVQQANLTYLGTINIAHNDGSCGDTPNARALGLTYNPSGNGGAGSFYISGRLFTDCIGEITKPVVGGTATFLQPFTHVLNGTLDTIGNCYNGCYIGGHLFYGSNLYVTAFSYYDADFSATKSIWRRSSTLSSLAGFTGPVAAGPGNQGMYNTYMDTIPAEFQSMLGGPAAVGGCCMSIISRTSLGPALSAFDPNNPGVVTPLVGYPDGHQTLNPWGTSGSHPEANPTTAIAGVTFIEGSDSVLFAGNTGTGEYCYGTSCYDPANPGVQGTHAYPYVHYMWAYDVDDLSQVKQGVKQPWEVFPYAMWEMPSLADTNDQWSVTGIAFDSTAHRLYIAKSRESDGSAWSQLYVYDVSGLGAPDTTPPAAPTGLGAQ